MREADTMRAIQLRLSSEPETRVFRNNVGQLEDRDGRIVRYGLCNGSSDLIGWHRVTITPDMVGQSVAIFTAIEVKQPGKYPTKEQRAFIDAVQHAGGIAGMARSEQEAVALVYGDG